MGNPLLNAQMSQVPTVVRPVNTQIVADSSTPQVTPTPAVSPGVTGQPVANNQTAAQAEKAMNEGVDAELKRVLGDRFSQPKSHFERVQLVSDALRTITDPAQRQAFVATIGKLGAPFGINFGLRDLNTDGSWGKPLNATVADSFRGVDAANNSQNKPFIDTLKRYVDDWGSKGTKPAFANASSTPDATPVDPNSPQAMTPQRPDALLAALRTEAAKHGGQLTKRDLAQPAASNADLKVVYEAWDTLFPGGTPVKIDDVVAKVKAAVEAQQAPERQPTATPSAVPTAAQPTTPTNAALTAPLSPEIRAQITPVLNAASTLARANGGKLSPEIIANAAKNDKATYGVLDQLTPYFAALFPNNAARSYEEFGKALVEMIAKMTGGVRADPVPARPEMA
jgi:hypothetical protein